MNEAAAKWLPVAVVGSAVMSVGLRLLSQELHVDGGMGMALKLVSQGLLAFCIAGPIGDFELIIHQVRKLGPGERMGKEFHIERPIRLASYAVGLISFLMVIDRRFG